jgi:SAM-dependent methyltransferase
MQLQDIKLHWQSWASSYGKDLRATTKGRTAKMIECAAIGRTVAQARATLGRPLTVLEVGCGNGFNCSWLASNFADLSVTGVDYIPEMIEAARRRQLDDGISSERLSYAVDDALTLANVTRTYDVVFTNRCLINLNTADLQRQALQCLCDKVAPGGYVMLIENSAEARARQDVLRQAVGLPPRPIDAFNTFIHDGDLEKVLLDRGFAIDECQTISSLHDLVLYVLMPMINGGKVDYEHPIVEAAAKLNIEISRTLKDSLEPLGQNRNVVARRPER